MNPTNTLELSPHDTSDVEVPQKTERQTEAWYKLLRRCIGGPSKIAANISRLLHTTYVTLNVREFNRRIARLKERGFFKNTPSRFQLMCGSVDMVRYFIKPGAEAYYHSRGINPRFHYILRILDDPASMLDPVGIRSAKDTIIGHVLQVVHANPIYDFQLLQMFEDGMDDMEAQTRQMLDGSHPRFASINAIVEDPEYYQRLLGYILRYNENPDTEQLVRNSGEIQSEPNFALAEMTYSTLPSFMRYASRMPKRLFPILAHWRREPVINPKFCDPAVVAELTIPTAA